MRATTLSALAEATCFRPENSLRTVLGSDCSFCSGASGCVLCGFDTGRFELESDTTFGASPEWTCFEPEKSPRATLAQENGALCGGGGTPAWGTCVTGSGGLASGSTTTARASL